jgi:membrane fusion protein (multidrug efflux system)
VIQTEENKTSWLTIPQAAIQRDQVGPFVLTVDQENRASVRRVKLGDEYDTKWIVTEGLSEGEPVIVEGIQKVTPGNPVKPTLAGSTDGEEAAQRAE